MPSSLPVPSKGALRTLRHLALGTSCTVAFTAGLVTEDRRRRIHAAREIHDNAQKLRKSRTYYSAGRALIDTLDDQVVGYGSESLWLAGDPKLRKLTRETNKSLKLGQSTSPEAPQSVTPIERPAFVNGPRTPPKPSQRTQSSRLVKLKELQHTLGIPIPSIPSSLPITPPPPLSEKATIHGRQLRLAADVSRLLGNGKELVRVEAAASRFIDAFAEGFPIDEIGFESQLLDAAIRLSKACKDHSKYDLVGKVLDIFLAHPPIERTQFLRFSPYSVIQNLIISPKGEGLRDEKSHKARLKKASSIYLQKYEENLSLTEDFPLVRSLGEQLCAETCRSGMYAHTEELFFRLELLRKDGPPRAVNHLIESAYKSGNFDRVFCHFKDYYSQTSPSQTEFNNILEQVTNSTLKISSMGNAVEALIIAKQIAESSGLKVKTTSALKIIGHQWRSTGDIAKTRELFDRLEPIIPWMNHPQAPYGAIIQFCIEAGQESVARSYYERLRAYNESLAADVRIFGHFVQAMAMRNDWVGVQDGLENMARMSVENMDQCTHSFVPVLKIFANSHSVGETEEFVRTCIDQWHLKLNESILSLMIKRYAQAREMDSILRWIDYAMSVGCRINVFSINTILSHCHRTWKFSFPEAVGLYRALQKLGSSSLGLTDQVSLETLGKIAVEDCPNQSEWSKRDAFLKRLGRADSPSDCHGVHRSMASSLASGNPAEALKIYTRAQDQIVLQPRHLVAAVKASLQVHGGNIVHTVQIIKRAQKAGQAVDSAIAALVIHQLRHLPGYEIAHHSSLAQNTISALEENGISISPGIVTHMMDSFVKRGWYRQAINLWKSLSRRLGFSSSSIDLVTLSVLVRCYVYLEDPIGIRWTNRVLLANGIIPDTKFYLDLKNARNSFNKVCRAQEAVRGKSEYLISLNEIINDVLVLRKGATEEKEHVRKMTIRILEKAILTQNQEGVGGSDPGAKVGVTERDTLGMDSQDAEYDQSDGSWTEPDTESILDFDILPTLSRLELPLDDSKTK
ncbi:hypothetical protein G7Y89_g5845 [Cudoniella acicularis]|uniref:Pentacotripeptide-repeat region of PRORP domain-containing protein n=1 Tax=Cudoniella acicularis TaxID=354080 RepID=A0A8H4RLP1_9HELO|nr:hypothetical protein G7Y89_g5845 [Cudoniella acicularis]